MPDAHLWFATFRAAGGDRPAGPAEVDRVAAAAGWEVVEPVDGDDGAYLVTLPADQQGRLERDGWLEVEAVGWTATVELP